MKRFRGAQKILEAEFVIDGEGRTVSFKSSLEKTTARNQPNVK